MAIGKGGSACSLLGSGAGPRPRAAPTPPAAPPAALAPEPPAPWPPPLTGAKAAAVGSAADWALPLDALLGVLPELEAPGAPANCLARSLAKRLMSWP